MLPVECSVVDWGRVASLAPLYSLASLYKHAKARRRSPVRIRQIFLNKKGAAHHCPPLCWIGRKTIHPLSSYIKPQITPPSPLKSATCSGGFFRRLFFPTNRSVQCRREAQAQCGGQGQQHTLWLQVESSTSSGRSTGEHKQGLGEVSCCGLCRAKTVRICFHTCANILSTPIFCQRQYFVDANILSMPIFLLTPIFCWCQFLVDANIVSTPLCFVGANILSAPMFCRRQYFVCA